MSINKEELAKKLESLAKQAYDCNELSLAKILYSVALCYVCGEKELWELEDVFIEIAQEAHLRCEMIISGGILQ